MKEKSFHELNAPAHNFDCIRAEHYWAWRSSKAYENWLSVPERQKDTASRDGEADKAEA